MTKKLFITAVSALMASAAWGDVINITTPRTSMVLNAEKGAKVTYLYYGTRVSDADANTLAATEKGEEAYPLYGMNCPAEPAFAATHGDGNMSTEAVVTDIAKSAAGNRTTYTITLKDKAYPLFITLNYMTTDGLDVIEAWTEIRHSEKKNVTLTKFASAQLPVRRGNVWISHLYGSWANEGRVSQEPLTPDMKVIKNRDGARNSHTDHAEVMLSLDGQPQENSGRTIAAALCYSGNYCLRVETHDDEYHHFFAGIDESNSAYSLKSGETFATPHLALTFSPEGLSGASRNIHRWGRLTHLANGNKERKILLNSWEGVYFDINQKGMDQMMADIASMGGELFVMDDGWFGVKYPRLTDNSSLGDWQVDTRKLPEGIEGLIRDAKKNGVRFGIWIEPEMTNSTSELYEKHPDWVLKPANRDAVLGRGGTQLVLDMANPKVQDFCFGVVDELMTKYPEIDYIKWDANMPIMNHGSQYLPADRQSHLYIEYHRGFEKVCQRIRAKYPELTIQACASGGGRANWGVLPYFDEFWVSDNTDALQRIYMQWGTSYFFPAIAMASHISAAPNHQTFRVIPLKYRIDVAMSGRLGMEIQPKNMSNEEKTLCRNAISEYKQIRPIVQFGNIYRLQSPYDNKGVASLMYVTDKKDDAVFYWWKTETFCNQHLPRIKMAGLDPNKTYTIHELNRIDNTPLAFEGKQFSGAYLMNDGLEIPYEHNVDYHKRTAWASRVLRVTAN